MQFLVHIVAIHVVLHTRHTFVRALTYSARLPLYDSLQLWSLCGAHTAHCLPTQQAHPATLPMLCRAAHVVVVVAAWRVAETAPLAAVAAGAVARADILLV